MSIKSELTKTALYLRSARKAILGRGGEISRVAGLKDLPDTIYKIPPDASLAYRVDEDVAYRKNVPSGVKEFAQVNKIGGMIYKIENRLIATKVTELVSEGANLLPRATRNKATINGVTFTVQDDNSIIVNGTATAETNFEILRGGYGESFSIAKGETYTASGCPKGGSTSTYRFIVQNTGYTQNFSDYGDGATAVANYSEYYAYIRISTGYTANNLIFKPMFNRGATAQPYSPCGTIVDTFPISAELREFLDDKGYGGGVEGYPNYIDFERKVFVQNTIRLTFDGTEDWNISDTKNGNHRLFVKISPNYIVPTAVSANAPILCNNYETVSSDYIYLEKGDGVAATTERYRMYFYDSNYKTSDISLWKAHIAELYASGNPLIVEYALAEPIEYDISAYLTSDNFIEVEGDGTITAVNEYEYDAPSTINYIYETVGL